MAAAPVRRKLAAIHGDGAHRAPPARLQFSGAMHGAADILIGAAAADVIAHGLVDIGVGGVGRLGQQRRRGHDLAGLAIAALRNVLLDPRLLDWVAAVGRQAFDGGDASGRRPRKSGSRRSVAAGHRCGRCRRRTATCRNRT